MDQTLDDLISQMTNGDRRALSRLLTIVEKQDEDAFTVLKQIWSKSKRGFAIGITGPAGAGKSSLIDQMIRRLRDKNFKVGVIAVDPSSPFSGGAVLGDRIRMQRHSQDPDVFIRSVGSHGKSGGISFATRALVQLMKAYGCDYIIIETVGAGQSEVEVMNIVDTTLVLLMPEAGDSVQALKAGILEIADLYVVNKKDRPGAERVVQDIRAMLSLVPNENPWNPPVFQTDSVSGEGVDDVLEGVFSHRQFLGSHPSLKIEHARRWKEMIDLAQAKFMAVLVEREEHNFELREKIEDSNLNIYQLLDDVLADVGAVLAAKRPKAKSGK
ncbi:MAG: methylmalonyl Co-A mutase-associated GTPase MeaB [Bdellovibrionales bacterium]|nr:methylmalonyl Co-A mutase-associated GTPase MeaB [Bdellovibrionales bacterium]